MDTLTPRAAFWALDARVSALGRSKAATLPVEGTLPGLGDQVGELLPFPLGPAPEHDAYIGLEGAKEPPQL